MVKVFRIVLTPPSQGFYSGGSAVSGYVELVTDVAKSCYECITVTLSGHAAVILTKSEKVCSIPILYVSNSCEDYIGHTNVLWDKHSAPDEQMHQELTDSHLCCIFERVGLLFLVLSRAFMAVSSTSWRLF